MNNQYTSNLKGWAVDKAMLMGKRDGVIMTVKQVLEDAEKLFDYCYSPIEEIAYLEQRLAELDYNQQTKKAIEMTPASNRVTQ